MIYIRDNFLSEQALELVTEYISKNEFKEVVAGDKSFWCIPTNKDFDEYVIDELQEIENKKIKNVFSFFRVSTDKLDTDWRIHADTIIMGERPTRALVLYFSDYDYNKISGTAFWRHETMGDTMPSDISDEEFDKILLTDSNDLNKWELQTVIGHKMNRLLSYPCNYFHSKFPNKSWKEGRIVYVMFYQTY